MLNINLNYGNVKINSAPVAETPYINVPVKLKQNNQVIRPAKLPPGTPTGTIRIS
jgi:hypothetical protein